MPISTPGERYRSVYRTYGCIISLSAVNSLLNECRSKLNHLKRVILQIACALYYRVAHRTLQCVLHGVHIREAIEADLLNVCIYEDSNPCATLKIFKSNHICRIGE